MDKYKITITENGSVNIPSKVKMTIPEIANLFGLFYQTAKREIRTIETVSYTHLDVYKRQTIF